MTYICTDYQSQLNALEHIVYMWVLHSYAKPCLDSNPSRTQHDEDWVSFITYPGCDHSLDMFQ